jgi:hypothetical protein
MRIDQNSLMFYPELDVELFQHFHGQGKLASDINGEEHHSLFSDRRTAKRAMSLTDVKKYEKKFSTWCWHSGHVPAVDIKQIPRPLRYGENSRIFTFQETCRM